MSETFAEAKSLFKSIRITLAISGAIALIAGIVFLVWPKEVVLLLTGLLAGYLVIAGLVYLAIGLFSKDKRGWNRIGHIGLGVLYVIAGVAAFINLFTAAIALVLFSTLLIGISWIVDGVVSLSLLKRDGSRVWTILYAILSILAGIVVMFSLTLATVALWWIIAVSLVVLGIIQIVRAITLGRDEKAAAQAFTETTASVE